jgi:predicted flap endonuclease-1-like 5' DNA nuclease
VSTAGPADDLTRIRAIDPDMQNRLNRLGVRRFADIAGWSASDVNRMSQTLGFAGRIEQENWIEQAHILAKGGETDYSRRRAAGLPPAGVQPPAAAPPPSAPAPEGGLRPFGVAPRGGADAATAAAAAAIAAAAASAALGAAREAPSATSAAATPAPQTPAAPAASALAAPSTAATSVAPVNTIISDRLHRILGINGEAERLLLANGVTRFSQIAAWTQADVDRFDHLLGKPGRIGRENWVEQAKVLVRGAEDADSNRPVRLADAIRDNAAAGQPRAPRSDLGHLRSVRSEALRGEPPEVVRPSILARPVSGFEDLKRIRGIGVLIEKKLNSLGIISYEQIANWTGADIDRISQILDFKGRIERENWVEQARILAAGGNTEFSRRMDRGDM